MNIQQIYSLAIKLGIANDLRGEAKVKKILGKIKDKYDKLGTESKKEFDTERLTNPYSDTRVLVDSKKEIKKVMVGIDIQPAELLIAKQMGVDLVIAHHPLGSALADLGNVMHLQADLLAMYGVPINVAESLTKERISEVARGVSASNHYRTVDAAKLLDIGLMCVHTPADNMAATFLDNLIKKAKPETVGEVVAVLKKVPEYQEAIKRKTGPKIFVGSPDNSAGKIVVTEITGGTEGAVGIYEKMSQAGIGTIIGMHMDEERKKEAAKYHINVVIAGHISSDSLGVNHFLDELEKKGIQIIPCSGLIRVSRNKKRKK
ncbi:MAG: Nif3-like dinuclear metal center hexameric protein [Patescibacteria group bacterium]